MNNKEKLRKILNTKMETKWAINIQIFPWEDKLEERHLRRYLSQFFGVKYRDGNKKYTQANERPTYLQYQIECEIFSTLDDDRTFDKQSDRVYWIIVYYLTNLIENDKFEEVTCTIYSWKDKYWVADLYY